MKLKNKPTNIVEVNGEKIHLRKDFLGWHQVHPIMDEDGKLNWKNLIAGGSWTKLLIVIVVVLLILGCIYEYSTAIKIANDCLNKTITIETLQPRTLQGIVTP